MQELIGQAKQTLVMSKDRFLRTFSFVPDDKLTWSPSPTAKSALQIAAHVGLSNQGMGGLISGQKFAFGSMEEMFRFMDGEEKKVQSRDEAVRLIEQGTNTALAALDTVTPERLAGDAGLPMPMPLSQFVMLLGAHVASHAAQIDYLQTTWGDRENHF